ncbi:MAG: hypothetical protein K8R23_20025 [Chthoniobacter sp.]|nr:hypothetical protein [Chthoniobacter sp.]
MRLSLIVSFFLLPLVGAPLCAQEPGSALGALRLLPRGESRRLARIVARDGTPVPERWHFIVHDPRAETGVHEYVVAAGEVVASRGVSQFTESLRVEDEVGGDALKVDSDRVAKLAQQYALVNNKTVVAMHYELKKLGAAAVPLWTVTCLDDAGRELGHIVISAGKGNVVSHEGFPIDPPPPATTPVPEEKPRIEEKPRPPAIASGSKPTPKPAPTPIPVAVAEPMAPPAATPEPRKPGVLERVGSGLQGIFKTRGREKSAE